MKPPGTFDKLNIRQILSYNVLKLIIFCRSRIRADNRLDLPQEENRDNSSLPATRARRFVLFIAPISITCLHSSCSRYFVKHATRAGHVCSFRALIGIACHQSWAFVLFFALFFLFPVTRVFHLCSFLRYLL